MPVLMGCALVLSVTGCGSGGGVPPEAVQTGRYRSYLEENAALLVKDVKWIRAAIRFGSVSRASSRYAMSRVRYSEIEPAAEAFSALNQRIDALESNAPGAFEGFHRLERAFFVEHTLQGTEAISRRLLDAVEELQRRLHTAPLSAASIAAGAARTLEDVDGMKLGGTEEPHTGLTLVDVSGNLEAVWAGLEALKPTLADDEELQGRIERQLRRTYAVVSEYGTPAREPKQPRADAPGELFVVYSELTPGQVASLRDRFGELAQSVNELDEMVRES